MLVLFLFFNVPLIEGCARLGLKIIIGGFVDNISILIYRPTIEGNYQIIKRMHYICKE